MVYGYRSIMSKKTSQDITVTKGGIIDVVSNAPVTGSITANIKALAHQGDQEKEVASAIEKLADAITKSGLGGAKKKEALDVVNDVATQANTPPDKRL